MKTNKKYMLAKLVGGKPVYIVFGNDVANFESLLEDDIIEPILFTDIASVAYEAKGNLIVNHWQTKNIVV